MTTQRGLIEPVSDPPSMHASQTWLSVTASDDPAVQFRLDVDTYESGWQRIILDPDAAAHLLAAAAHLNDMSPEQLAALVDRQETDDDH